MDQHLTLLLLGLADGAVFAALALALVVTYRSSGVVNFATGVTALFGAYTYGNLREGKLLSLIPGTPDDIDIGTKLGLWPAVAITLLLCAVLGLVLYLVVYRPLRTAPAVARAVASIGVMVVITELVSERVGTVAINVKPIFPNDSITIGSVNVSQDRIWFAAAVVVIALAVAALYRFTRFGLATRAAAESEKGAYVSSISPDRIAAINWMISTMVAGLAGILIAPISTAAPIQYTLFIVPALAAAILGRFQLIVPAVLGGLVIGMVRADMNQWLTDLSWLPKSGLPELVPLVLILLVLVVRAKPLPTRGALIQQSLGRAPRPRAIAAPTAVATLVAALALVALHSTWRAALVTSLIFAVISLSLVVVTGYAGQVSLAQLTLAGVAGFLLGPLTQDWVLPFTDLSIPFPLAPLLAALGAAVVGVVLGLPAIRIRGLPVAVVTLAMAVAIEALWFRNNDFVTASGKNVSGPTLLGVDLRSRAGTDYPRIGFCLMVLVVLVGVAIGVAKLRTSRLGSAMLAVRANERSAAASGIDVVRVKLYAFAIGAFIAGLGGSMLGYLQGNVTYSTYAVLVGLGLFATTYLAGITSVSGGILAGVLGAGGIAFAAASEWLSLGGWYAAITGVLLIFTVIKNPEGIIGPLHTLLAGRRDRGVGIDEIHVEDRAVAPFASETAKSDAAARPDLLSVRDLRVQYGGVIAVDGVSFDVAEGTIVGLIGPNGAGKTTLLDAISGFAPSSGAALLADQQLDGLDPFQRARSGLGRTFQAIELYDDLSVRENVVVGLAAAHGRTAAERLEPTLALLGLVDVADRPAGELSQGRRQLVSVARALVAGPKVLLLDEPAGGLDSTESQWLGERLRAIRDSGVTILLIDHDMHLVLNLCDEVIVLNFGVVIADGPPATVKADRAVAAAYLGTTHATVAPTGAS